MDFSALSMLARRLLSAKQSMKVVYLRSELRCFLWVLAPPMTPALTSPADVAWLDFGSSLGCSSQLVLHKESRLQRGALLQESVLLLKETGFLHASQLRSTRVDFCQFCLLGLLQRRLRDFSVQISQLYSDKLSF